MGETMASNKDLQKAKNAKNDEFYTPYDVVEEELSHYQRHFKGKTVLCNCDNPYTSNFCKYFLRNFNVLGLKRLICTSLCRAEDREECNEAVGYVLNVGMFCRGCRCVISESTVDEYLANSGAVKRLRGDGDFRSEECISYLRKSDIVVTNPPFSLFKELISLISKHRKSFLLIGNQNALTYKEVFPLIRRNEAWVGYRFGDMRFMVPPDSEPHRTRYWVDENGQKWRSLGNAMWLTNLDVERRHVRIPLRKRYVPETYPKYDAYDAINVSSVADIPYDYPGVMGVPITFVSKYNESQFEIVGEANHGSDCEFDLFKPTIGGRELFKKLLVRNKRVKTMRSCRFRILDLFCGAGGFSHGMEQNPHFSTEVALDFNPAAIETFSHNMPYAETVVGDITDEKVKRNVIELSRQRDVNMVIGGPPCQGFSLKGKKLGLSDPRNYLFNEYLKIVEALQPQVFVIENVKALLSTSAGWFRDQIVKRVSEMGYFVEYGILKASDFGVPQLRQRAIFICSKGRRIELPNATCTVPCSVRDAISDLAYLNSGEGEYAQPYRHAAKSDYQKMMRTGSQKLYNHQASRHAAVAIKKLMMIPPERGKECLPKDMIGRQVFSGTWGRLRWDDPSPTIDTRFDAASNGRNNHPYLHRAITPREAARIQSFDDCFVFIGGRVQVRQQIGNAVPPLLAKAIADQIDSVTQRKE